MVLWLPSFFILHVILNLMMNDDATVNNPIVIMEAFNPRVSAIIPVKIAPNA